MYTLTNRTFGIEIEAKGLSHTEVVNLLRNAGFNADRAYYSDHTTTAGKWKVKPDASVQNGFEVVSPILSGEQGIEDVRKVMNLLDTNGAIVDRQCGLHVHWGVSDWDLKKFQSLYKWYAKFEQAIDSILAPSRRLNNSRWARGYSAGTINHASITDFFQRIKGARNLNQLRQIVGHGSYNRYTKLNMEAFWAHRTIEFRQHQGTLNSDKAEHWIRFTGGMIAQADAGIRIQNWGNHEGSDQKFKFDYMIERMVSKNHSIPTSTSRFLRKRYAAFHSA